MRQPIKFFAILIVFLSFSITRPDHAHQGQDGAVENRPGYKISPEIESVRKQISGIVEKFGGSDQLPGISYEFYYQHSPIVVAGKSIGPTSPVSIASTSKSFTAFAMVRLARMGKVDLDAPVSYYLPDFAKHEFDRKRPVTVRHLLQHRSGIPYQGGKGISVNGMFLPAPRVAAGRYFEYSNMNYELVAAIIEKVTGKRFKAAIEELVLHPLRLKNTYLANYGHGASGIISSTTDLSAFADFLIQDYELNQNQSYIRELTRPPEGVPSTGNQEYYGLGWRITLRDGQLFSMYHAGDWHQGVSLLMIYPKYSASFSYLANPPDYRSAAVQEVKGNMLAYSQLLAERLAKSTAALVNDTVNVSKTNQPERAIQTQPAQRTERTQKNQRTPAKAYIGEYKSEYNGVRIEIGVQRNRLTVKRGSQLIALAPLNDWEFQGDSEYLTYQFFFDEKNNVIGMTDYTSYYTKENFQSQAALTP